MIVLLGILVIYKKDVVLELIPFFLGIIIMASGFSKLQDGIDAKRIGYTKSWIYIALGVVSIVLGIVIMFIMPTNTATNVLFILIGASLLYSGLTDLYSAVYLSNKINKFIKELETVAKDNAGKVIDVTPTDDAAKVESTQTHE